MSHAPAAVGIAPFTPTFPVYVRTASDPNLVLRDVWCGDGGGCVALNHVIPPGLHYGDRDPVDSIAVFIVH